MQNGKTICFFKKKINKKGKQKDRRDKKNALVACNDLDWLVQMDAK